MTRTVLVGLASAGLMLAAGAPALAQSCAVLSAADIQVVAGVHVTGVGFMSKPGAGGKCGNYATDNGRMFLGVSRLSSAGDYKAAVDAVPASIYPTRIALKGVGDEGVLMKGSFSRYLVVRKGGHGVVLFPFGKQPSDDQLEKLAALAVSR